MYQVAELAGIHCQLWLHRIRNEYQYSNPPDYAEILGRPLAGEDAAFLHEATLGGLPDFGFILGSRWDVATRGERHHYNLYFLRLLNHLFPFHTKTEGNYCALDVSLNLQERPENTDIFVDLPQPQLFRARAYTLLPGQTAAIPILYDLEQDLTGWHISEITVRDTPLSHHYSTHFSALLAKGGYAHLTAWLIQQIPVNQGINQQAPAN